MRFEGSYLTCTLLDGGIAELTFDAKEESVNKFSLATLEEFAQAIALIQAEPAVKGLLGDLNAPFKANHACFLP